MRFKSNETALKEHMYIKRHKWFAWYPVVEFVDNTLVWWEWVERSPAIYKVYYDYAAYKKAGWEYFLIDKNE